MNTIKWQSLLLFDFILISRYIMVIWLKNPAALKDDFWATFINIVTLKLAIIVNFVIFFFPKRQPLYFYTCSNTDPTLDYQISYSEGYIEFFSITLYLFVKARLMVYRHWINPSAPLNIFGKKFSLYNIEKQSIVDLTSLILNQCAFALLAVLSSKVNKIKITEINDFPNNILVYLFQLLGPPLLCNIIVGFQFVQHKSIRKETSQHCREILSCIKC